jgi:hypothetical protein
LDLPQSGRSGQLVELVGVRFRPDRHSQSVDEHESALRVSRAQDEPLASLMPAPPVTFYTGEAVSHPATGKLPWRGRCS